MNILILLMVNYWVNYHPSPDEPSDPLAGWIQHLRVKGGPVGPSAPAPGRAHEDQFQ